jgi:hypothetical protein
MKKAQLATGAGIAVLAFLFGVPFVRDQNTAVGTILDIADFICSGTQPSTSSGVPQGGAGASAAGAHDHAEPAGLYMPMFSTPPKGGAVYNGPPLDQC